MNLQDLPVSSALETPSREELVLKKVSPFLQAAGYQVLNTIGKDAFGVIVLARNNSTQQKVAIKCIKMKKDRNQLSTCINEAKIMRQIKSQYAVRYLNYYSDQKKGRFFLVMEYYPDGNLDTFIKTNPEISKTLAIELAEEIHKGLKQLHEERVIHGDLKPENIFLTKQDDGSTTIKLGGFGMAKILSADQHDINNKGEGIQLLPFETSNGKKDFESDYYSERLIIRELCGQNNEQEILNMTLGTLPDYLKLALQMTHKDPEIYQIKDQEDQEIKQEYET